MGQKLVETYLEAGVDGYPPGQTYTLACLWPGQVPRGRESRDCV